MKSPYEILGVPKDADENVITKMYRKLSKRFHPDRNPGDDEAKAKYAAVDLAYRTLIDPVRRSRFDSTGVMDEPRATVVDPEVAELCKLLQPMLIEVLQEVGNGPFFASQIKTVDVVEKLKLKLANTIANAERHLASVERGRDTLKEVVGRFIVKEGETNILSDIARTQLTSLEAELTRVKTDLGMFTRAKKYLSGVSYRRDGYGQQPLDSALFKMISYTES